MNENLSLVEILKDCPEGMKLYSPAYGELVFDCVKERVGVNPPLYVIRCYDAAVVYTDKTLQCREFKTNGSLIDSVTGLCVLFPSREQLDWSKFEKPKQVEVICPERVYWFAATKDVEKNKALLAKIEELTGLKAEEDILDDIEKELSTSPFIYNSRSSIIRYYMDNSAEFQAWYLFGTELRIKEEEL